MPFEFAGLFALYYLMFTERLQKAFPSAAFRPIRRQRATAGARAAFGGNGAVGSIAIGPKTTRKDASSS